MRNDNLARRLSAVRWPASVSRLPAAQLWRLDYPPSTGTEIARAFGPLVHYTNENGFEWIQLTGHIGGPGGCWLTPTGYAACMVPYNLGLRSPRDRCLLIDVSGIDSLWGPGTAPRSDVHANLWKGGGVEFFTPEPVPVENVIRTFHLQPCGDIH